jgi:hypothetical protein
MVNHSMIPINGFQFSLNSSKLLQDRNAAAVRFVIAFFVDPLRTRKQENKAKQIGT